MVNASARDMIEKEVVSVDGGRIGTLCNVVVDVKTGALIDLVVKPDIGLDTSNYRTDDDFVLIPFTSVRSIEDFVMVKKT